MAQKRMFTLEIVDSDAFLDMPSSSQAYYFHLAMRADDDGFVDNPKKIMKIVGAQEDDLKILIGKRFLLTFDNGIIVIKHWRMHNYIQKDRYHETKYVDEKNKLVVKENESYTECVQDVSRMEAQVRLGKVRQGKASLGESEGTPAQEAKEFFNTQEKQAHVLNALQEKYGQSDLLAAELKKFVDYWTELSKSGTKQRWELQATFEVKKRLTTWLNNIKQFNQKTNIIKI